MAGKFVISTRKDDKVQFVLKAGNGEVILASQPYAARASCVNGIESVKTHAADEANFELLTSKDGKHYFNLKASNGQVIGSSEMYESEASRKNGIASVMKNAPEAATVDA